MNGELKKLAVALALGAALLSAGCGEENTASKTEEKPAATATIDAAKDAVKDAAAKVDAAADTCLLYTSDAADE